MRRRSIHALLPGLALLLVAATAAQAAVDKVVFRDDNYPLSWMNADNADQITTYLTGKGYTMVDAKGLDDFMLKHIADHATSVVVFANDVVPDTIANMDAANNKVRSPDNDLNRYLRTGGKIVYLADWPAYYIGQADGSKIDGGGDTLAAQTFEFYPANWCCNNDDASRKTSTGDVPMVVFNDEGKKWGLTKPWQTYRATDVADSASAIRGTFTVLGNPENNAMLATPTAMPWVRTFTPDRPGSGFLYLYDRPNQSGDFTDEDLTQIQKVAEYFPNGEVALSTGISGTVKTSDGKPAPGMRLTVTTATGPLDYYTDAAGQYFFDVPAGSYTVTIVPSDPSTDIMGGTVPVTVAQGQVAMQDLTITVTNLPHFTLDNTDSTWKFLKEPTVDGKVPTQFDPAILAPTFDDSKWEDQDPTQHTNADSDVIAPGNFWLRGHFKLGAMGVPSDFPVDRAAVMYNFQIDARSLGIWVNGVAVGSQPGGDDATLNTFMVPSGVLNKTGDNVIVIRGENGSGDMGFYAPINIRTSSATSGSIKVESKGADPSFGGVGGGTVVKLLDSKGNPVASATTRMQGDADILNVAPGAYSLSATGPLVDNPATVQGIQVAAGQTAVVTLPTNPAKGLSNAWLNMGGPWRAIVAADPKDLKPAQPDFDDSKWSTVTFVPGTLNNTDQALPDFGDNQSAWERVKFTVPADWASFKRDLVFDDWNAADSDTTFFNGQQIGQSTTGGTTRSYTVPQSIVKFGGDNVIAILFNHTTGDEGINDRTQSVRLHVAAGTSTPQVAKGDLNGDGKVDIKDATLSLQIAVGSLTPSADQTAAGDVNGDGKLNIQDTTLILAAAVGIRTL